MSRTTLALSSLRDELLQQEKIINESIDHFHSLIDCDENTEAQDRELGKCPLLLILTSKFFVSSSVNYHTSALFNFL